MGTRADFYVGRGEQAEWLGSIAWDGYPDGIDPHTEEMERTFMGTIKHKSGKWEEGKHLFDSATEEEFRERVTRFFQYRDDVSLPADGWPWPWDTSSTTDYAYAFDGGKVYASCFGSEWFDPKCEPEEDHEGKSAVFPDMKAKKNMTLGKRSGLIVITTADTIDASVE